MKITPRHNGVYETLKTKIDLAELVEQFAELEHDGEVKEYFCPLKEQSSNNPAFKVYDDRFYCFSCEAHGDVVNFWRQMHNFPTMWDAAQDQSERGVVIKDVAKADGLNTDIVRDAISEMQGQLISSAPAAEEEDIPEGEWAPLLADGVLDRYCQDAFKIKGVVGDEDKKVVKLLFCDAIGAQLEPLPTGKPVAGPVMLTGDSGRGKNFLADAAVCALPEEWYLSFEAASATAFYYAAELDPAFLKHKFIYPNEAEAVDTVVEFLRPMFSQARAKKFVTNKNSDGTHVFQEISVEGPITGVVPTTRNTLNRELQTRMLVVELEDYKGRIKQHTAALSKQFAPDFVADPHAGLVPKWRAALRSLTGVRKVVILFGSHAAFNLDNEDIGHGARLWGNLLGLMCAHAWLEQRNREIREVNGTQAVVATAADYKAAYELLKDVGRRSVVNLGETHRKIVQAVYDLKQEEKDSHFASDNFSVREIAKKAEVSPGTVSKNRTFLVTSASLLYEDETTKRLSIANDADPSWWQEGDPMKGFPKPSEVAEWDTHPADPGNNGNTETPAQKGDTYAEKPVSRLGNTQETPETPTQVEAVELNGNLAPGHASGNGYKLVTSENLHEYLEELESEDGDEDPLAERHTRREARRQRRAEELHINSPERFHELPADEQDGIRAWVRENVVRQREPLSSYSLKHVAEKALGFYVGNGEIKGAMLEAGYTPLNTHRERGINFYFQAGPQKVKE